MNLQTSSWQTYPDALHLVIKELQPHGVVAFPAQCDLGDEEVMAFS